MNEHKLKESLALSGLVTRYKKYLLEVRVFQQTPIKSNLVILERCVDNYSEWIKAVDLTPELLDKLKHRLQHDERT